MHTVKEVSEILNISIRAVQKRAKGEGIPKTGNTYHIPGETLRRWENELSNEPLNEPTNEPTNEPNEPGSQGEEITETFSVEQYEKLQEVIQQYPNLLKEIEGYKNEIEFLRTELKERSNQMDKLINTVNDSIKTLHQTNYLSAKDKGYDNE